MEGHLFNNIRLLLPEKKDMQKAYHPPCPYQAVSAFHSTGLDGIQTKGIFSPASGCWFISLLSRPIQVKVHSQNGAVWTG